MVAAGKIPGTSPSPLLIDSLENQAVKCLGCLIGHSHAIGNIDLKFFSLLGRNFSFLIRVMN